MSFGMLVDRLAQLIERSAFQRPQVRVLAYFKLVHCGFGLNQCIGTVFGARKLGVRSLGFKLRLAASFRTNQSKLHGTSCSHSCEVRTQSTSD